MEHELESRPTRENRSRRHYRDERWLQEDSVGFLTNISCTGPSTRARGAGKARQLIFSSLSYIAVSISGGTMITQATMRG